MTDSESVNGKESDISAGNAVTGKQKKRRAYIAPKIMSADRLEAAAATCSPPAGGFGKHVPMPCGTVGS